MHKKYEQQDELEYCHTLPRISKNVSYKNKIT